MKLVPSFIGSRESLHLRPFFSLCCARHVYVCVWCVHMCSMCVRVCVYAQQPAQCGGLCVHSSDHTNTIHFPLFSTKSTTSTTSSTNPVITNSTQSAAASMLRLRSLLGISNPSVRMLFPEARCLCPLRSRAAAFSASVPRPGELLLLTVP